MRAFYAICILVMMGLSLPLQADEDFCGGVRNTAFNAGEVLTYKVLYKLANVYVGAGEAVFTNTLEQLNGKEVYHVVGEGKTYSFYDKFYKVRDRYESYIDTNTLQPYKFVRNVNEGGYKTYENVSFIKTTNTAVTMDGVYKVPSCIQDVISAIFYAETSILAISNPMIRFLSTCSSIDRSILYISVTWVRRRYEPSTPSSGVSSSGLC